MSQRSVAVIFGGASSEYEVSLRSASFVISGVDREKYDLTMVGITKKGSGSFIPVLKMLSQTTTGTVPNM